MSDAGTAIRSFEIRLSESSRRITGIPEWAGAPGLGCNVRVADIQTETTALICIRLDLSS